MTHWVKHHSTPFINRLILDFNSGYRPHYVCHKRSRLYLMRQQLAQWRNAVNNTFIRSWGYNYALLSDRECITLISIVSPLCQSQKNITCLVFPYIETEARSRRKQHGKIICSRFQTLMRIGNGHTFMKNISSVGFQYTCRQRHNIDFRTDTCHT